MDNTLVLELYIFLTAIYSGLIVGFVYDIYRTIRYYSKPGKLITYIGDMLFFIVITFIFFAMLVKSNWGEIRGYIILGFIIGIIVYFKIFSKLIFPISIKVGRGLKKVMERVLFLITCPFKVLERKLFPRVNKFKKIGKEVLEETKKYKKIISSKK